MGVAHLRVPTGPTGTPRLTIGFRLRAVRGLRPKRPRPKLTVLADTLSAHPP